MVPCYDGDRSLPLRAFYRAWETRGDTDRSYHPVFLKSSQGQLSAPRRNESRRRKGFHNRNIQVSPNE